MTIKDIFRPASLVNNWAGGERSSNALSVSPPALSVLSNLESPFMDISSIEKCANLVEKKDKRRTVLGSIESNTRRTQRPQSFMAIPPDPYASLKLCDQTMIFGELSTMRVNSFEFRKHLEIVRAKQQAALDMVLLGTCEFNFLFRDFVGHLTTLIDSVKSYAWVVAFVVPFLQLGTSKLANCIQAYGECTLLIQRLARSRYANAQFITLLLANAWHLILDAVKTNGSKYNVEQSTDALCSIIEIAPLNIDLLHKIVFIRAVDSNHFDKSMVHLRLCRAQLLIVLVRRLSHSEFDDVIDAYSARKLLQETALELELTYKKESNPQVKLKLRECRDICHLTGLTELLQAASLQERQPAPPSPAPLKHTISRPMALESRPQNSQSRPVTRGGMRHSRRARRLFPQIRRPQALSGYLSARITKPSAAITSRAARAPSRRNPWATRVEYSIYNRYRTTKSYLSANFREMYSGKGQSPITKIQNIYRKRWGN